MDLTFLPYSKSDDTRYEVAERFVHWLERKSISDARGDEIFSSQVDPTGRVWLGRLGPKDFVTMQDERSDRLEPCAIGFKLRPAESGPWSFTAKIQFSLWSRQPAAGGDQRWDWTKSQPYELILPITVEDQFGQYTFGANEFSDIFSDIPVSNLSAEIRVKVSGRQTSAKNIEVLFINTSPDEVDDFAGSRFFECSLEVIGLKRGLFQLEALPDSFRFNRDVEAFGFNCGFEVFDKSIKTCDGPAISRSKPRYWASSDPLPDLSFQTLDKNPIPTSKQLLSSLENWAKESWSSENLEGRAKAENWSPKMRQEATDASKGFWHEFDRIKKGCDLLSTDKNLRFSFQLMNRAMKKSAGNKYSEWRPFQFAFLLANLECLVNPDAEAEIVDIVWFATGGGKTETYLGLLLTAAYLDRIRGKLSGITAWSRFPLRMLSLQQTQRFANALGAAELVRKEANIVGDPFSLGFLVGGTATPNRIKKESQKNPNEDVSSIEDMTNPFRLVEECPFCRIRSVITRFDRSLWRLSHFCTNEECPTKGEALPLYVVDDEIWRFLPTIVIGTLDKAANISRQSGMRGLVGAPWGLCTKQGHGYTYAHRKDFPHGCLVPDCKGSSTGLPIDEKLYAPSFRLQDELHLLRDSLGAVDSHYESALDGLQEELSGRKPKILASSATLSGYEKQVDVLYQRKARVFPQLPPRDGEGFWSSDSNDLRRRYVALAPRRLTVEFVVDRLIITLQQAIRDLLNAPEKICSDLQIDPEYAPFLVNCYGTNVIYGNTLQDIDAVVRSSETQYASLNPPPNVATLTGRTDFDEVRNTLDRLETPEEKFEDRIHLIAASSMMSHGVDIDRLNVMIMLALPLGVAEFIQATARVGRRWPALVVVIPKMTRERDASVYRSFPQFVSHGDRFVEPIPITRKSRRVLERTISGLELARLNIIHEPQSGNRIVMPKDLNNFIKENPDTLQKDQAAILKNLGITANDEFMVEQLSMWFESFSRNLRQPGDKSFINELSPTGQPMTSLRDVEEQAPVKGDSSK